MTKEYIKLLHEIEKFKGRVPALREIIFQVITRPEKERAPLLKIILGYLRRYPEMKITGLEMRGRETISAIDGKKIPFTSKIYLKGKYECQDCKKEIEQVVNPIQEGERMFWDVADLIGKKETETYLVCIDCYNKEYYEPEYEADEPSPLTQREHKEKHKKLKP